MKKLFGVLMLVLMVVACAAYFTGTVYAFEPGGQVRFEVGGDVGSDLSGINTGDIGIKTEIRLDPHHLFRIEATGTTGWNNGVYSKALELDELGVFVMPARGDSLDVGCGVRTSGLLDGNTQLSFETSNKYWLGCLTEIRF